MEYIIRFNEGIIIRTLFVKDYESASYIIEKLEKDNISYVFFKTDNSARSFGLLDRECIESELERRIGG